MHRLKEFEIVKQRLGDRFVKRCFGVPKSRYSVDRFVLSYNDLANSLHEAIGETS